MENTQETCEKPATAESIISGALGSSPKVPYLSRISVALNIDMDGRLLLYKKNGWLEFQLPNGKRDTSILCVKSLENSLHKEFNNDIMPITRENFFDELDKTYFIKRDGVWRHVNARIYFVDFIGEPNPINGECAWATNIFAARSREEFLAETLKKKVSVSEVEYDIWGKIMNEDPAYVGPFERMIDGPRERTH